MRRSVPLALAVLAASCSNGQSVRSENGGSDVRAWMRSHFEDGRAAKDALAQGDVGAARAALGRLAEQPAPQDAPARWEAGIEAMRSQARRAADAADLPAMSDAIASLAMTCGSCHREAGASVPLEALTPPAAEETPEPMQRHRWAAERMWEGLVAPAPDRFQEGAAVLAEAPMHPAELVAGQSPPLEVVGLAERARSLAGEASRAASQDERAALYGQLLATCAACHTQL